MDEQEWLACSDPRSMLEFLQGKISNRKLRLFYCACARLVWHLLTQPEYREAVEAGERYVDGRENGERLQVVQGSASDAFWAGTAWANPSLRPRPSRDEEITHLRR